MKRFLSCILILALLAGFVPVDAIAAQINDAITPPGELDHPDAASAAAWIGDVASGFARGSGTTEYPYIIETAAQLAYLAQSVNSGNSYADAYIMLAADIDLSGMAWTAIGQTAETAFAGIFCGNGYTISGLKVVGNGQSNMGLFGFSSGTIRDLKVVDATGDGSDLSGTVCFAGLLVGTNSGTITGCSVSGTLSATTSVSYPYFGGLAGNNDGSITQCTSAVTINVTGNSVGAGGLTGTNGGEIYMCRVDGSVTATATKDCRVGGISCNFSESTDATASPRISHCYSTAAVSATTTGSGEVVYAGGLVGTYSDTTTVLENCFCTGSVAAKSVSGSAAGGVVGYLISAKIINCYTGSAKVSSTHTQTITDGASEAGKLVGTRMGGTATNCYVGSGTTITRTYYYDDGCDAGNTTGSSATCTLESGTFTYGTDNMMTKMGWSEPWVANGNNPALANERYVRCTVRYLKDGVVVNLAHQFVPNGTALQLTSPTYLGYLPDQAVVNTTVTANCTIDVTYNQAPHAVNVTCVDGDGNVIDVYAETVLQGLSYSFPVKTITGYTPRQTTISGTMGAEDQAVTVIYDINSHPVTIYYKYLTNDAMAAATYSTTLYYGESLSVTSPNLVGYKVANDDDAVVTIDAMPDSAYEKTVYYVQAEQLAYTVVTMVGTEPLGGVSVTFNGETRVTDSFGHAVFLYDAGTETVTLQIHADGYSSQTYEQEVEYRLNTDMGIDFFDMKVDTTDNPNYSVRGISCFGNNIDSDCGIINVKYDGNVSIVVQASIPATDTITELLLVQEVDTINLDENGQVVENGTANTSVRKIIQRVKPGDACFSSDGTCEFTVKGTQFAYSADKKHPIYVYLYTQNALAPVVQKLNINTISLSTQLKFDGLFDGAEISLDDTGFPLLDGTKLSFEMDDKYKAGCPISVEIENNEIYIGYNVLDAFEDEIESMKDQNLFGKLENAQKRGEQFMQSMADAVNDKFAGNRWVSSNTTTSFKIEAEAAGGMCFRVYEDGKIAATSYAKVALSMNASWTTDFVVVIIPITVEVKAGVTGEITVTGLGLDFENQEIIWPSTTVSLEAKLGLSAGIGNRFASAGVFGRISVGTKLVLGDPTYFDVLVLNGEGGFYAKLNLGLFKLYGEKSWTFLEKTIKLAPEGSVQALSADALTGSPGYVGRFEGLPVYDLSAYELDTVSDGTESTVTIPTWYASGTTEVEDGTLETASSRLITVGEQEIMIYFSTDTQRDVANAKTLMFRTKAVTENTWSDPLPVEADDTGDTAFDIILYGGKLYIAYAEANKAFLSADYTDTTALLNDITFAQDITTAVFDPDSGTFLPLQTLTADTEYDTLPTFGVAGDKLYLTWNKNTAQDDTTTFCMNAENDIWCAEFDGTQWSQPQCILRKCYPVVDLAVTGLNGTAHVALIVDEDASLYTEDDQNLYLVSLTGTLRHIDCYGTAISDLQAATLNGAPLLLWRSDDSVMALSNADAAPFRFSPEGYAIGADFRFLNVSDELSALVWGVTDIPPTTQNGKSTSAVYGLFRNSQNVWSSQFSLLSIPYHLMDFDAVAGGSGIQLSMTNTYLSTPEDTGEQTLASHSKLLYTSTSLPQSIQAVSHTLSGSALRPPITVEVTLSNTGATHVDTVTLKLIDQIREGDMLGFASTDSEPTYATKDSDTVYDLGEITIDLAPGESGTFTANLTASSSASLMRTRIVVLLPGESYFTGTSVVKPAVGDGVEGVDLSVTGEYVIIGETEYISLRTENLGDTAGSGILKLYRQEADGTETLVYTTEIDTLLSKNIKYELIRLEKDFFQQTAEDFRCVIESTEDVNAGNNTVTVLARKLEGAAGTERDLLVEAPQMSAHEATFDKYTPADVTLDITLNEDLLQYVGCVDDALQSVDHTLTESEDGLTLHVTMGAEPLSQRSDGEYLFSFLFLTELGYIDAVFHMNIVDSTPIPITGTPAIHDESGQITTAQRGMKLTIDTSGVNTEQLTYEWLLDGAVISTERTLEVAQDHLGKTLTARVTGASPYYGSLTSASVYVQRLERNLAAPTVEETAENTVTLCRTFHVGSDSLLYGYAVQNDPNSVAVWQAAPTLTLPGFGTYYLFTKAPGTEIHAPAVSAGTEYTYTCTHSYENGTCTNCGAADPNYVPLTVTAKSFTLSFEDEILVNFYYTVSDLTEVTEHGMLVFASDPGTADYTKADFVYSEPIYDSAKDRYMATTVGIAAKEMGDTRYYVAYAKLTDGTCVYSGIYDYSPKKYAMNMLSKTSTSDKQKALCVAMLNYGAAAQEYFGYNVDSLMNAELTDQQKALVAAYDAALFTGSVAADSSKTGSFVSSSGFSKKTASVSFESAFAINYYFTPNAAVDGDMTMYCWTPEVYASADTLTAENASGTMTMVDAGDGRYWAQVTGIPAKCLDETYYVAAIYADADGNTYCTGVVAYSLSKYCMNNAVDGKEMQNLAAATAMYGYYAKLYFA